MPVARCWPEHFRTPVIAHRAVAYVEIAASVRPTNGLSA
jgi:hypothetical protein